MSADDVLLRVFLFSLGSCNEYIKLTNYGTAFTASHRQLQLLRIRNPKRALQDFAFMFCLPTLYQLEILHILHDRRFSFTNVMYQNMNRFCLFFFHTLQQNLSRCGRRRMIRGFARLCMSSNESGERMLY